MQNTTTRSELIFKFFPLFTFRGALKCTCPNGKSLEVISSVYNRGDHVSRLAALQASNKGPISFVDGVTLNKESL